MNNQVPPRYFNLPAAIVSTLAAGFVLLTAEFDSAQAAPTPPAGYAPLFNGKDLTGWRGGSTFDHRKLLAMTEDNRAAQIAKWTKTMTETDAKTGKPHWYVENQELVNDGFGDYATTEKDYGNFELMLEYRTVPKADSGIYLRGVPQVQIWDPMEADPQNLGRAKGSGGLWNNSPGAPGKDPLVLADKPLGQWNQFRILMVGARVSIWLNEKLVADHALLENYYDRKTSIPAFGPIQLQTHGGEIRWRNVYLREIAPAEATRILAARGDAGFNSVFNGKDFNGWAGPVENYEIRGAAIVCKEGKGGTIYTKEEYGDFAARLEFKTPSGGNNGLAIRYPGQGDAAYHGMCELQILDDHYDKVKEKLDPRQVHGSAYGMAAAQRGYHHPVGEWNFQEIRVTGSRIQVELNGVVILNADLNSVTEYLENKPHPGKGRTRGHFGFAGHNDPVSFRNVRIKPL